MTRNTTPPRLLSTRSSFVFICSSCLGLRQIPSSFSRSNHWKRQVTKESDLPVGVTRATARSEKEANQEWTARAVEIRNGTRMSLLSILEQRGYVNSIAGSRKELEQLMIQERFGAYVGIDPTAPSLHVGHLLPLMALFWLYVHGVRAVTILGGGTAKVGDPTGRTAARELVAPTERKLNVMGLHYQLKSLWINVEQHATRMHGYERKVAWRRGQMNNTIWLGKLGIMEFLQRLGNGMKIGTMLGREMVRSKIEKGIGISFSEFTYPLLQAWDWWHMHQAQGITVQIGGSDQLGNIMAGIDAVKHLLKTDSDPAIQKRSEQLALKPMGFTVPLLTTASGEKFGKSAGNAVWLDKQMTSIFDQYQFFFRSADADVGQYLRFFTFIPIPEIEEIMSEHEKAPSKRIAQRRLAQEVIALLHGKIEADVVESQHLKLFSSSSAAKTESGSINQHEDNPASVNDKLGISTVFNAVLPESLVYSQPMGRILYHVGLAPSRSEGHRLVAKGGAYIGSQPGQAGGIGDEVKFTPVVDWDPSYTPKFIMDGNILFLRTGKWKIKTVKIVSDEEFDEQGLDCPGWKEWKEESDGTTDPMEEAERKKWANNSSVRRRKHKAAQFLPREKSAGEKRWDQKNRLGLRDGEKSKVRKYPTKSLKEKEEDE